MCVNTGNVPYFW